MSDRGGESVSVHGSERVAARDYLEIHDFHESHATSITAHGSQIYVSPPTAEQSAPAGPEIGYCRKCEHPVWIHAAVCRHCGYDPRIEAERRKAEASAMLVGLVLGWIAAGALLYQLAELIGLPAAMATKFAMIGGAVIVGGVLWLRAAPLRWMRGG